VLQLPKPLRSTGRPRIGLVWEAGRYLDDPSKALEYSRKTIPSDQLEHLCAAILQRKVDLVLLQPGYDIPDKADFLEQAQAVQRCDLLLSVDTAAAHLGGAIGHPTWLLLPWAAASRWQRHRDDSELYPGMRLIRQPRHGDWQGLIQHVLIALDDWLLRCF
jgi:ADP-heptose:LPS heptosyltransferase